MNILYTALNDFYGKYKPLHSFNYNIISKVDGSNMLDYPAMILESPVQLSDKPGCQELRVNIDFQDLLRNTTRAFSCPDADIQARLQVMAETLVAFLINEKGFSVDSWSLMFYSDHSDNVVESCRLSMTVRVPKVEPCVDLTDSTLWYQGGTDIRPEKEGIIPQSW